MARVTVRVNVPSNPDELIALLETTLREHQRQGASSPIPAATVTPLQALVTSAKADRQQARDLNRQAQDILERSNQQLGLAAGQTTRTPGTGVNLATQVRDLLLALNVGNENALEPFGFQVTIGTAASPKKKTKGA